MIDFDTPNENIPFVAYTLIGITTLVLTYASLMDKDNTKSDESSTSMLPSMNNEPEPSAPPATEPEAPAEEVAKAVPIGAPPAEAEPTVPVVPVNPMVPTPSLPELNGQAEPAAKPAITGGRRTKHKKNKRKDKTKRNRK